MGIVGLRITVTTTATPILQGAGGATQSMAGSIINIGPNDCDLGGATVAAGSGYPLTVGSAMDLDLVFFDQLYAITAAGTTVLAVLKLRQ